MTGKVKMKGMGRQANMKKRGEIFCMNREKRKGRKDRESRRWNERTDRVEKPKELFW